MLARAIAREGFQVVAAGLNPHDLRRGIQIAVDHVIKHLGKISRPITSPDEIEQVRTSSPAFRTSSALTRGCAGRHHLCQQRQGDWQAHC